MSIAVHRRPFDLFISHAHTDGAIVRTLVDWLGAAGLSVWFDDRQMPGGSLFGLGLHEEIRRCRGLLVIVSQSAAASGWVRDECNVARDEQNSTGNAFRLVPLVIDDTDVSELLRGLSALKAVDGAFDARLAQKLLLSQYPAQSWPPPKASRDVYVSASWHEDDSQSSRVVCRALIRREGFRLIGDSRDQYHAGVRRGRPGRAHHPQWRRAFRDGIRQARTGDAPYKYFLQETALAEEAGLPVIVIAVPRVRRADRDDSRWLRLDTHATDLPADVQSALAGLWHRWRQPVAPQKIFCAVDQNGIWSEHEGLLRDLIERVTGLPTCFGDELRGDHVDEEILRLIRAEASLVIADLSDNAGEGFNVDVCIEAGMARGAGKSLVWRSCGAATARAAVHAGGLQMTPYRGPTDLLALVHRIVRPYRRRVINAEFDPR